MYRFGLPREGELHMATNFYQECRPLGYPYRKLAIELNNR